ncbi:MAG: cupin domain-containing protein [Pseudomonadota bacterium]
MNPCTDKEVTLRTVDTPHLVRYDDLVPCTTAFIDTRTPGSAQKENFTIIGPGVSESPDQHVHISIPHGFNIGGARQPPNCTNSQHSHETAEVFIVHSGRWAFYLGEDQRDGRIELGPGDTISIPTHVFRGFENIGKSTGFLFAVLGGDDPGKVLWAPYVFEQAQEFGLVLMDDGSLHDGSDGRPLPPGKTAQAPTTAVDVAKLRRMNSEELADCVVRYRSGELFADATSNIMQAPVIGAASDAEQLPAAPMAWQHGFQVRYGTAAPQTQGRWHVRPQPEVILMHRGQLCVRTTSGESLVNPGDTLSLPAGISRCFETSQGLGAEWFSVHGGDHPSAATPVG